MATLAIPEDKPITACGVGFTASSVALPTLPLDPDPRHFNAPAAPTAQLTLDPAEAVVTPAIPATAARHARQRAAHVASGQRQSATRIDSASHRVVLCCGDAGTG